MGFAALQGVQYQASGIVALQRGPPHLRCVHKQMAGAVLCAGTPVVQEIALLGCGIGGALQVACGRSETVPTAYGAFPSNSVSPAYGLLRCRAAHA